MAAAAKTPVPTEGAGKRERVRTMFADIADRYDFMNSLMSLGMHRRWRRLAVGKLELCNGDIALDVCCGTGDFLPPLHEAVGDAGTVVGVDYCRPMLVIARKKPCRAVLASADACALPFSDSTFEGVAVGWGLRNLANMEAGLSEIARVLKPGGRLVCLDMALPKNRMIRWGSRIVCGRVLPTIGGLFGNREAYAYLSTSTESFSTREELAAAFVRAGLVNVGWRDLLFGNICMHWGMKP